MIKFTGRTLAFCLVFFLSFCFASAQSKQWPETFLWRISGNGLSKPSYLYGTIHLADKRLFYFTDSLYYYFEKAESFHIEVDADTLLAASIRLWSEKNKGRLLKSL